MNFLGNLDRVTRDTIRGWCFVINDHEAAHVEIRINGNLYKCLRADELRQDLKAKGLHPTGCCGFLVQLPADKTLIPSDPVSVRIQGAPRDLAGSPSLCKQWSDTLTAKLETISNHPSLSDPSDLFRLPEELRIENQPSRTSWQIFSSSFHAYFLREVKIRFGAQKYSFIWAFLEPIFYILMLQAVRSVFGGARIGKLVYGVDALFFMTLGVVPFFLFLRSYSNSLGSISGAKSLFNYRQLKPIDTVLVRVITETCIMLIVLAMLWGGLWWYDLPISMHNPLEFFACLAMLCLLAVGLGLFADVYITRNNEARRIAGLLERPLLLISGVFYTMKDIPDQLLVYLWWNPIFHAIDLSRGSALEKYTSPASWLYLCFSTAFILLLGLASYRRNLFRLTQQ